MYRKMSTYKLNEIFLMVLLSILCLHLVAIRAFTTEDLNTDLKFIKTCNRTSPISLYTMNEVLIHKKLAKGETTAFQCFLHCLFAKYGWMDEEGGFLLREIKRTLEESDVEVASLEYILYKCTAITSVDKCERSFLFTQCFWNKMAEQQPSEDQLFYSLDEKE